MYVVHHIKNVDVKCLYVHPIIQDRWSDFDEILRSGNMGSYSWNARGVSRYKILRCIANELRWISKNGSRWIIF